MSVVRHYEDGLRHRRAGRLRDAKACFETVLMIQPDHPEACCELAGILRVDEDWSRAIEIYASVLGSHANMTQALLGRALCQQSLGEYEESSRDLEKLIALNRDDSTAWVNLGVNQLMTDDAIAAMRSFRAALSISSNMVDARMNLATALRSQGFFDQAVDELRHCLRQRPDDSNAHCMLGAVLFELGRKDQALVSMDASLDINPYDRRALAYKSVFLAEAGRHAEARRLINYEELLRVFLIDTVAGYESVTALNSELARHVQHHKTLVFERAGNTTRHGGHTGNLLLGDKGPCAAIELLVNEKVRGYLAGLRRSPHHQYLAWQPDNWRLSMWAVVMHSGGYQDPHIHAEGWISGVYYVQIPETIGKHGQAGYLEFGRGVESLGCQDTTLIKALKPAPGMMVLFPSYYYHRTIPFVSDERRICIAFDVRPIVQSGGAA